jgi:phosphate:Na+ symporter
MTTPDSYHLDWFALALGLLGGLALFLYGLDQLSEGLKQAAGDALKTLLTRLTSNRFLGALTGAVVTGILNSSSVTTVLVVGFVTAGVMSLPQSVAVIMGANIGSTVTAQLLAFNLSAYSLLGVAVGFFILFGAKRGTLRYWGMMLMGLGLIFFGMGLMSDAMKPLRSYPPFVSALAGMAKPLYGILAGAVFTGLVQSSAATVGIAIALASEGLLTLPAGIALALGANIGTCVTALLAALGKPTEAVRAAAVHVLFNVLGVIVWFPFIGLLARLAIAISPVGAGLEGAEKLAAEVPRQVANANTLFNVINTALFIGFTGWFARLASNLVPARHQPAPLTTPHFLDKAALSVPAVALEQARQEMGRLGDMVTAMLAELRQATGPSAKVAVDKIAKSASEIETLEAAIVDFLGRLRQGTLTQVESKTHVALMTATIHLWEIADIISDDLLGPARAAVENPSIILEPALVSEFYGRVHLAVQLAVSAVRGPDVEASAKVLAMSGEVRQLGEALLSKLAGGFNAANPEASATLRVQTAFVDALRQTFTLAKRVTRNACAPENRVLEKTTKINRLIPPLL